MNIQGSSQIIKLLHMPASSLGTWAKPSILILFFLYSPFPPLSKISFSTKFFAATRPVKIFEALFADHSPSINSQLWFINIVANRIIWKIREFHPFLFGIVVNRAYSVNNKAMH